MCSLRSGSTGKHLCGATLIAPDLAVTAAFCVASPKGTPDPVLYCGLTHLWTDPPGSYDVLQTVRTTLWVAAGGADLCAKGSPTYNPPTA